jgi:hypothetical protein
VSLATEILSDAPVHFWPCASAPSQLAQDVGSAPATLLFNTAYQSGGFTGPDAGSWAYFISANNQLQSQVALALVTGSSMECWVWLPFLPSAQYQFVAWDGLTGGYDLFLDATNHVNGASPGGALAQAAATTARLWHQVVVTYDATDSRLYVDGALVGTFAGSGAGFNGALTAGARAGANGMSGLLSNIAYFPTKLSAARVLAHWNAAALKTLAPVFINAGSVVFTTLTEASAGGNLDAILAAVRKTFP